MNKLNTKIEKIINKTKAKFLEEKTLYQGKFITLKEEKYKLPNNKILIRESIKKNKNKEAVIIISMTKTKKFILVVQNRTNEITSIEFPSGYIEENEEVEDAAKRELQEETGYISEKIEKLDTCFAQLGIENSIIHIVLAKNCKKISSQNLGEDEYINYDTFTLKELENLIKQNYIKGCGNKLAYYELKDKYKTLINK